MYHYLRNDLKVKRDVPYEILTAKVQPWSYDRFRNRYVHATGTLQEAMTKNPHLKVFVASGYYDLATPFRAAEYSFDHLGLAPSLHENIVYGYYPAGHMMYLHGPSLKKLKDDLTAFYQSSLEE
jgi:carboxypeptidase C (cathepsin A)